MQRGWTTESHKAQNLTSIFYSFYTGNFEFIYHFENTNIMEMQEKLPYNKSYCYSSKTLVTSCRYCLPSKPSIINHKSSISRINITLEKDKIDLVLHKGFDFHVIPLGGTEYSIKHKRLRIKESASL